MVEHVAGGFLYEALGFRLTLIVAALTIIVPTALTLLVRDVRTMTIDSGNVAIRT
jgi:hypothetical protein